MRTASRASAVRGIFVVLLGLSAAGLSGPAGPEPFSAVRLLPPVLLEGETGWTLAERMRRYKVEGVSVAVIRNFQVAWEAAAGLADREAKRPATAATLFQAGSISKPVAAAGVLREVEKGVFQLDANVNGYLKSWKVPENPQTQRQKVTLERILSHGAGLTVHGFPGYAVGEAVPTLPQVLDGSPPANTAAVRVDTEPGTKWRYSGGGYTIAQLAMVDTLARPFPQLMRELVLAPAGMTKSTYEQPLAPEKLALAAAGYRADGAAVPGKRHTYPEMAAAGLWTTAGDLARFGIAIAKSRRGDPGSLLQKATAERMTTVFLGEYALGFAVEKHGSGVYFSHGGADEGFQAYLIVHRDKGYGAAVMANSDNGIQLAVELLRGIAKQDSWEGYLPEPLAVKSLPAEKLTGLTGRYQTNGDEAFSLEARGGRLFGHPASGPEYELHAVADDLFVRKDREIRYRVQAAPAGVTGILLEAGQEQTQARRMAPGATIPSDALAAGRIDAALAEYRALFAAKPSDAGIAEGRLNQMGYELAARGETAKAIAILKLNTELYPSSANTYDSLGEIELKSGDRAAALASARKVLEALPGDTKAEPSLREQLRRNAENRIKELSK
jgi:CubicO group peptidase (beta-lactamase class C family)